MVNGNDYRIVLKRKIDNFQLSIVYLYVELNLIYVNSRFIDYAKLTDIPDAITPYTDEDT